MVLSRLHALNDWLHTHEGRKILRYSLVSAISTGVSLFVIALVYGVLHLWSEVPSTIFGNAVATFPSYWLNRKWAWGKHGRSHFLKEMVPFWTLAALGIAFAIIGAALARHVAIKYNLDHFETSVILLVANVISFAIFWVAKLLIFNRLFRTELDEFDEHLTREEEEEELTPH
jgi:putative flippase GtrA